MSQLNERRVKYFYLRLNFIDSIHSLVLTLFTFTLDKTKKKTFFLSISSYKNSEFNPVTLKFKSKQVNYCDNHRLLKNKLFRCLPGFIQSCLQSNPDETSDKFKYSKNNKEIKALKMKDQLIQSNENQAANIAIDNRGIIDDLSSNCPACMKENKGFSTFNSSREKLYNSQPSLVFKYHIGMSSLMFLALATVILVSELTKYALKIFQLI